MFNTQAKIMRKMVNFLSLASRRASRQAAYVKIYGERNTGANFLRLLVSKNTTLKVISDGSRSRAKERLQLIRSSYCSLGDQAEKMLAERLLDSDREASFLSQLGWQHGCPSALRLRESPLCDQMLFLCLIRNPWSFAQSLHKNPYNIVPLESSSFEDFVQCPILANVRDNLNDCFLASPIELWNHKVASYVTLQRDMPGQAHIFYYEEIVLNPEILIRCLSSFATCIELDQLVIPHESTKAHRGEQRSYNDYKRQIRDFDPVQCLGLDNFKSVNKYLDDDLARNTPYAKFLDEYHYA